MTRLKRMASVGVALVVVGVALRALWARLPGWNPESLWNDDLAWGAIVRGQDLQTVVTVPAHAPPVFLAALWGLLSLFRDPEWSLQLLPFVCGIVAIPVMACLVRRLTGDNALAILAACLTALNPLLAHYTVFVKQYSLGFLSTALLLLGATVLFGGSRARPNRIWGVSLVGGLGIFVSFTSVFASAPVVILGAARHLWFRETDRRQLRSILAAVGTYLALVLAAYVSLQNRANDLVRSDFGAGFIELNTARSAWTFLSQQGRRLIETSLPSWVETDIWQPETMSWALPIVGLGLAWLLARRRTRMFGLVIVGFYAAFLLASALRIYPLGIDRTNIFAFPAAICLFAAGVHALTELIPRAAAVRMAVALGVAALALYQPVRAAYWDVNDDLLIEWLSIMSNPSDGLILSPNGTYLAAYYGGWPVEISSTSQSSNATQATIDRERTVHLPHDTPPGPSVEGFLEKSRSTRIWYLAFRTGDRDTVLEILSAKEYKLEEVARSSIGRLYVARDLGGQPAGVGAVSPAQGPPATVPSLPLRQVPPRSR